MTKLVKKSKKITNFYKWAISLFLSLFISIAILLSLIQRERNGQTKREKSIQDNIDHDFQQYRTQKNRLILTLKLSQSSNIKNFFTDLLKTYAEKFAEKQNLSIANWSFTFGDFYFDERIGNTRSKMGFCSYYNKTRSAEIYISYLYLLNKFGSDFYYIPCHFTNCPDQEDHYHSYIDITFAKMIETCSHELAHYLQLVKQGRSSCKDDLLLNVGNYSAGLTKEHEEFSKEIYEMIKQETSEWKKRWEKIKC